MTINTDFGHIKDGELVFAVKPVTVNNVVYFMPNAEIYASIGELPVDRTPPDIPEGYHISSSQPEEQDGKIVFVYTYEKDSDPVHTYKKSYLAQWMYMNGKLDAFIGLITSNELAKFMWDYCTEFDSNHPQWSSIAQFVQNGLSLTDDEFASLLSYGELGE